MWLKPVKTRSDAATGANTELMGGWVDAIDVFQKMAVRRGSFSRASLREDYLIRFKGTFSALVLQKTSAPLAACF